MLCIMLKCQLYPAVPVFINVVRFISLLLNFSLSFCLSFVRLLFSFDSFAYSLFIVHCSKEKRFNSDPGLYSRYFDPVVREVPVRHHQCKSNKHHTSDCTDFVLV
jgi:hypothetical protein